MNLPKAPLPVRVQLAVIRSLIRNYQRATQNSRLARFVFCHSTWFDDYHRRVVVQEILSAAGDWSEACKWLKVRLPGETAAKLFAWADKVKGGAL